MGLILAVAGFCYATSTTSATAGRSVDAAAAPRLVGSTNLRFTNPLLPNSNVFDLGDATYGTVIQRYVTAAGGVRPYSFGSPDLLVNLANNSSLFLGRSGYLFGSINRNTLPPLNFTVLLTDSTGSQTRIQQVVGNFKINVQLGGAGVFRFAVDNINNGQKGLSYVGALDTLGSVGTVAYSVLPNTLTVNGSPRGTDGALETIGLSLAADGTISGKPLEAGLVSFKARAVDSLKRIANDRTNSIQDQVVSFNIEDNALVSNDYTTLTCSVKGDLGAANKDTVKFSGFMNLGGSAAANLRFSTFVFRLGGISVTGRFDVTGKVVNLKQKKIVLPDGSIFTAKVDPHSGVLSGSLTKATVLKLLNGNSITDRGTARLGMLFVLSNNVLASDLVEFATRRAGNKISMDYKLGKSGRPLAGSFQILSVSGKDAATVSGTSGDIWTTKFMIIPRFGIDTNPGLDALSSVTVRIGQNFVQKIPGTAFSSTRNGNITLLKPATKGEQVAKLTIDGRKFVGSLQTFPLGSTRTFISPAVDVKPPAPSGSSAAIPLGNFVTTGFDLGIDLARTGNNASFTGEYGKLIIGLPGNKAWVDRIDEASHGAQAPAAPQPQPAH
jgi:hypothetical protein